MTRVEYFKALDTNLDNLYNSIKEEIKKEKNLKIVWDQRETTISIIGDSNDFAVEVASGAWFESLLIPGITSFIVGGPLGAVGGTTVGLIMAYQYERKIWKRIREVINRVRNNRQQTK